VYPVIFTQIARTELIEAQDWYEREAPGLGRRFRESISPLVERISHHTLQFSIVYKNVRRALLKRFAGGFRLHALKGALKGFGL
jgi:hypothetical protein